MTHNSFKSKSKQKERANLAIEKLFEALLEESDFAFTSTEPDLPKNLEEALSGPEAEFWKAEMEEEVGTLGKMETWKKVLLPEGRKAIGCRWVFTKKHDEHGNIIKYKARLVAQGFSQKPGTDYSNDGTFAPVMRLEILRTDLAFAAINSLKLRQFDVKGAYLHGRLTEEIYTVQPPGYDDGSGAVCLLQRSLYGLKQAGMGRQSWTSTPESELATLPIRRVLGTRASTRYVIILSIEWFRFVKLFSFQCLAYYIESGALRACRAQNTASTYMERACPSCRAGVVHQAC